METTQTQAQRAHRLRGTADLHTLVGVNWEEQTVSVAARRQRRLREVEAQYDQEMADLRALRRLVDGIVARAAALRAGPDTSDAPGAAAG